MQEIVKLIVDPEEKKYLNKIKNKKFNLVLYLERYDNW